MNINDDSVAQPVKTSIPLCVEHRRNSQLPLRIPEVRKRSEAKGLSFESIREKFKLVSPHEREILRKLGFKIQRGLLHFRQAK